MSDITDQSIKQCSLTLGKFDSETVNVLVTLFHHQKCSQLILLSNNLNEKFENLLTINKANGNEASTDTPLTRIELAIMMHFKQKYLTDSIIDNDNKQLKSNIKYSIDDELDIAYCFLLAQIDDRLSEEKLSEIKFLLGIRQDIKSLFDVYEKLNEKFPKFFSLLIQCGYFTQKLVIVDQLIRAFQLFIKRYEDFLNTFEKYFKISPDTANTYTQTDAILNQNNTNEISSFMNKFLSTNREQIKSPSRK
jgi:tetratricopeptide (TPR) repeat protein